MKAVKGNKEYKINEASRESYRNLGYDIVEDDGKIIAYGKGKTIAYEKHEEVAKELETAKEKNEELAKELESLNKELEGAREVLISYAEEHEYDLGKTSTTAGIVKKIKECQEKEGK